MKIETQYNIGDTVYYIGVRCDICTDWYDHCHYYCKEEHKTKLILSTTIKQFRILGNQFDSITDTDTLCSSTEKHFYLRDYNKTWFTDKNLAEKALRGE
jgi:hypothetical protein